MNEQLITDTTEHCDFYVGNEHYDKSYEEQQRLWVNKFAELIIEKCANHITNQQDLVETNWQCKDGIHIVYSLKEHFGIE